METSEKGKHNYKINVPELNYGNYDIWKEAMLHLLKSEFGVIGTSLEEDRELTHQDFTIGIDFLADSFRGNARMLNMVNELGSQSMIKNYIKALNELPNVIGRIFQYISRESLQKVKTHADFEQAYSNHQARVIWRIIRDTHLTPDGSNAARSSYENQVLDGMHMEKGRNIYSFNNDITNQFDKMELLGDVWSDERKIMKYFSLLHADYVDIVTELLMNKASNPMPRTFTAAKNAIVNWYFTKKSAQQMMGLEKKATANFTRGF